MAKRPAQVSSPFDALVKARHTQSSLQPVQQVDGQTSKHLDSGTVTMAKSVDPDFLKFTTYIRKRTHRAVKVRLVEQGRELSDLVEELLSDWLQRPSPLNS
jgi:hypothetical protein